MISPYRKSHEVFCYKKQEKLYQIAKGVTDTHPDIKVHPVDRDKVLKKQDQQYKKIVYYRPLAEVFHAYDRADVLSLIREQKNHASKYYKEMEKMGMIDKWLKEEFLYVLDNYVVLDDFLYPISALSDFYKFDIVEKLTEGWSEIQNQIDLDKAMPEGDVDVMEGSINEDIPIGIIDVNVIREFTGYTYKPLIRGVETEIPWQKKLMEDRSRFVVVLGSRQIGKTLVIAEKALEESFNGMGRIILCCAFMVDTTGHVKRYLRAFIRKFPAGWFVSNMNENYIENTTTGTRIYFRSLSEGGDRVRGFTAHVVIMDECMLIANEIFERVILPTTTTTGGQVFMISTPGPKNWFWKECMRAKSGAAHYSYYEIPVTKNPFMDPILLERIMEFKDRPSNQQEFFCKFSESDNDVFRPTVVGVIPENVMSAPDWIVRANDPARKGKDESAYSEFRIKDGIVWHILSGYIPEIPKREWETQATWLWNNLMSEQKGFFAMDCTGSGDGAATLFQKKFTVDMVINYTNGTGENLDTNYPYGATECWKVGKPILINLAQDLLDGGLVKTFKYGCKVFLDEIEGIMEKKSRGGVMGFEAVGLDDATNSFMIGIYYIIQKDLINRKPIGLAGSVFHPLLGETSIATIQKWQGSKQKERSRHDW